MIDEIFKIRLIEEIVNINKVKDKKGKLRMRLFSILSFILALGSTSTFLELTISFIKNPEKRNAFYFTSTFILFGFAITFWLTFILFLIAYVRNIAIKKYLANLKCESDKKTALPADELTIHIEFQLTKKVLKDVKVVLSCQRETSVRVLDMPSAKKDIPYKKEVLLAENLSPQTKPYSYQLKLAIPKDALKTQEELSEKEPKVTWGITVHFDFLDWHSYEEHIPLLVI